MLQLVFLCRVDVFRAGLEVGARVLHTPPQPQRVEVVPHVVVILNRRPTALTRMPRAAQASRAATSRSGWAGPGKREQVPSQPNDLGSREAPPEDILHQREGREDVGLNVEVA